MSSLFSFLLPLLVQKYRCGLKKTAYNLFIIIASLNLTTLTGTVLNKRLKFALININKDSVFLDAFSTQVSQCSLFSAQHVTLLGVPFNHWSIQYSQAVFMYMFLLLNIPHPPTLYGLFYYFSSALLHI